MGHMSVNIWFKAAYIDAVSATVYFLALAETKTTTIP